MKTETLPAPGQRAAGRHQRGAALVVGLLLLLVLTILAISGMTTATLELQMAGNRQYQERAFQAAEAPDTLFQRDTLGYSAAGHRLYARELAKRILRNSAGIWERPTSIDDPPPAPQATTHRAPHSTQQ